MLTRTCTACGTKYPATTEYFYADKSVKLDGLASKCRKCRSKQLAVYRESNRSEIAKRAREAYAVEPRKTMAKTNAYKRKNEAKVKVRNQRYYECNKEQFKQYGKLYRDTNAEKIRLRNLKYYAENSGKLKQVNKLWMQSERGRELKNLAGQRRRNARKAVPNNLTASDWDQCTEHFSSKCAYCGKEKKLTYEHFHPLSKGGEFTINNIIPACDSCNKSKNSRGFFDWYPKQSFYSKQREQKILTYLNYKNNIQQFTLAL